MCVGVGRRYKRPRHIHLQIQTLHVKRQKSIRISCSKETCTFLDSSFQPRDFPLLQNFIWAVFFFPLFFLFTYVYMNHFTVFSLLSFCFSLYLVCCTFLFPVCLFFFFIVEGSYFYFLYLYSLRAMGNGMNLLLSLEMQIRLRNCIVLRTQSSYVCLCLSKFYSLFLVQYTDSR